MNEPCQCEHIRHFPEEWEGKRWMRGHKYFTGRSVGKRAYLVGPVCNWCAVHCMADYLI